MTKKILIGLFMVLILAGCGKEKLVEKETDALKFKNEYESINEVKNTDGSSKYLTLDIPEDNPMKYVTAEETVKLLEEGTGILYLGFRDCPWCRNAIGPLIEAAKEGNINTIYYLDPKDIRDDVTTGKKGTEEYEKMLKILDEYLNEYTYTNTNGDKVSANKKRIYVPEVFFIEKGKVIGHHFKTVDSQEISAKISLTADEKKELKKTYLDLMNDWSGICDTGC